jgi:hypothetical protein
LAVEYADWVAMGRAVRNAQVLASKACAVTVVGQGEGLRPQLEAWRDAGRSLTIIEGMRSAGSKRSSDATRQCLQTMVWAGEATWSIHADLSAAATEARRLASLSDGARVALILVPCHPKHTPGSQIRRAASLAGVANPGSVVSDEATAMALVQAGWGGTVEELGELLLPSVREPIWSVLPA